MKLIILLSTLIVQILMQDIITVDEIVRYEKEILLTLKRTQNLNQLIVDHSTNSLYFSYEKKSNRGYQSAILNLDTKEFKNIEGVRGGNVQTVDQNTHAVYIAGNEGIFEYNITTNNAELIVNITGGISDMFFKDTLYYTSRNTDYIYKLENGNPVRFTNHKADRFLIDNENNIYIVYGFFFMKDPIGLFYNGPLFVYAMSIDNNGKVYACTSDGLYEIMNDDNATFKKIASPDAIILGIAFDKENNIILAECETRLEDCRIVRLKPTIETETTAIIPPRSNTEIDNCFEGYEREVINLKTDIKDMINDLKMQQSLILSATETMRESVNELKQRIFSLEAKIDNIETDYRGDAHVQRTTQEYKSDCTQDSSMSFHIDIHNNKEQN